MGRIGKKLEEKVEIVSKKVEKVRRKSRKSGKSRIAKYIA